MTVAQDMLYNNTLNQVWPLVPPPPLPDKDARDYALEVLRDYICALEFQRTGAVGGPTIAFTLPEKSVCIYQPDDIKDAPLPGIGVVPGLGVHDSYGLGPPPLIDGTEDIAGPGTQLQLQSEYVEPFVLEVWGSKHAERRALMAGLKAALRASDGSYSIGLKVPAYYDQVAIFTLNNSQYVDGDEVSRNRRRGHLMIELRIDEVQVVNVRPITPSVDLKVLDGNVYPALDSDVT